jgi:hypothetical protein
MQAAVLGAPRHARVFEVQNRCHLINHKYIVKIYKVKIIYKRWLVLRRINLKIQ